MSGNSQGCGNMTIFSSVFIGVLAYIAVDVIYKPKDWTMGAVAFVVATVVSWMFISNTKIVEGYEDIVIPKYTLDDERCKTDEWGYCEYEQISNDDDTKSWGGYSNISTYETVL
jgi:hypothetical protein